MIRLGSKYEIEDLKERGLGIMHNDNPTKLQDWDNLNSDIKYDRCGVVVRKILEIVYDYSLESAKPMAFFSVLVEVSLVCRNYMSSNSLLIRRCRKAFLLNFGNLIDTPSCTRIAS